MSNQDIGSAWKYHDQTKHSFESVRQGNHAVDRANLPMPYKVYADLPPMPLPLPASRAGVPALRAIAAGSADVDRGRPSLRDLGHLLYFSGGITKRRNYRGNTILFRAAACTGALYEIELYVVCGALKGLPAGVYHFNPGDQALRLLREGDFRAAVAAAAAREESLARAPLMLISTGTYWRNAWKYQARTYRHFGWDNGTIHANLLATAAALGIPARVVCGFVDAELNRLLDLDVSHEVSLAVAALGQDESPELPPAPAFQPLGYATVPLSKKEVDYPEMRRMHLASSLMTPQEVAGWRAGAGPRAMAASAPAIRLAPLSDEEVPQDGIEEVILRRGSSRRFRQEPIRFDWLSTILDRSTRGIAADFLRPFGARLNDIYVIVHAVEGLSPGAYFYNEATGGLELLKPGRYRDEAAYLALEQRLAGDAAVVVFFLADLQQVLERFGNRGYRAVQLEAGILGGKMYLAAYAQNLGATGLTFYDDEVTEFFSPHARGKSAIFQVALGRPARRAR